MALWPALTRMRRAEKGIQQNALGHSRGGFSTKIHAIVDAKGQPLHVTLTAGERHEMVAARELLDHAHGVAFVADTGYDSNELRAEIKARGLKPVIHSKPERHRALLPRAQAIPRDRHSLRQDQDELPRADPGSVHLPLARVASRSRHR